MFCAHCGKELPEIAQFCPNCGTQRSSFEQSVEPIHNTAQHTVIYEDKAC